MLLRNYGKFQLASCLAIINENTVGADASVEALKLYHMKLSDSSLLALLALVVACIVQKTEMIDRDRC